MKSRMLEVDGLRGLACMGIVFGYHCRNFFSMSWMDYLAYFVEVFFIVSGFMMAYNYKDKITQIGFKAFFTKRYINLMCIYWVTFIVWVVIFGIRYLTTKEIDYSTFNLVNLFFEFFGMLSGWIYPSLGINSWFFNVLVLCYILFYFLCKLSSNTDGVNQEKYIIFCMFMLIIALVGMVNGWNFPFFYAGITLRGEASFAVGLLLYELSRIKRSNVVVITGDIVVIITATVFLLWGDKGDYINFLGNTNLAMILILCPIFVLNVIYNPFIKRLFSLRILRWIGEISMNVYLWHTICLYFVVRIFGVNMAGYCAMIISSLLVGAVSHYFLEPKVKKMLNSMISHNS